MNVGMASDSGIIKWGDAPLYHGTPLSFSALKPSPDSGILWLASMRGIAGIFAAFRAHWKATSANVVWEVGLKPGTRVVDIGDTSGSIARELKRRFEASAWRNLYGDVPLPDETWATQYADFGLVESQPWVRGFLRSKKVECVIVEDAVNGVRFRSFGLLRMASIATATPVTLDELGIAEALDVRERRTTPVGYAKSRRASRNGVRRSR